MFSEPWRPKGWRSGPAGVRPVPIEGNRRRKKPANSQPPVQADERVNQVLAPVRDEHHLPGLIGAILTGDRLAAIGALGIRKIGSPEPIRVTDQVHLGSCTKAMTATMIGTLVDEGKLTWGSTIREVFPEVAATASSAVSSRDALAAADPPRGPAARRPVVAASRARPRPRSGVRS